MKKLKVTFELDIKFVWLSLGLPLVIVFSERQKKKSFRFRLKYLRTWKGHNMILLLKAYNTLYLWITTSLFWQLCYTSAKQQDDIQEKSKFFFERINLLAVDNAYLTGVLYSLLISKTADTIGWKAVTLLKVG